MKKITYFIISFLLLMSCDRPWYKRMHQIRDGLYIDKKGGDMCLKYFAVDESGNKKKEFICQVFASYFEDATELLKEVVDAKSFHSIGNNYYQDKNHTYFLRISPNGALFLIVENEDIPKKKLYESLGI